MPNSRQLVLLSTLAIIAIVANTNAYTITYRPAPVFTMMVCNIPCLGINACCDDVFVNHPDVEAYINQARGLFPHDSNRRAAWLHKTLDIPTYWEWVRNECAFDHPSPQDVLVYATRDIPNWDLHDLLVALVQWSRLVYAKTTGRDSSTHTTRAYCDYETYDECAHVFWKPDQFSKFNKQFPAYQLAYKGRTKYQDNCITIKLANKTLSNMYRNVPRNWSLLQWCTHSGAFLPTQRVLDALIVALNRRYYPIRDLHPHVKETSCLWPTSVSPIVDYIDSDGMPRACQVWGYKYKDGYSCEMECHDHMYPEWKLDGWIHEFNKLDDRNLQHLDAWMLKKLDNSRKRMFRVCSKADYYSALSTGMLLATESERALGFMHMSATMEQARAIAARKFNPDQEPVILTLDSFRRPNMTWIMDAKNRQEFPHVYGTWISIQHILDAHRHVWTHESVLY